MRRRCSAMCERCRWRAFSSLGRVGRSARNAVHPTAETFRWIRSQIRTSSRRGVLVPDPFADSGPTLIAREMLGCRCRAMEIGPAFAGVIRPYREFVDG